jgi:hypothetical protein
MKSNQLSYAILSSGNSKIFRAISIPLASNIETMADDAGLKHRPLPDNGVFTINSNPRAICTEGAAAVGILLFVGSWFASKILDEIYEIKLKPIIRKVIQKADEIELFSSKKHTFSFIVGIHYEDQGKLVIVALKTNKKNDLLENLEFINNFHTIALRNIEQTSDELPIHLYIVEDGKANQEPIRLNNLQEMHDRICI